MGREAVKQIGICDTDFLHTGEMLLIKVTLQYINFVHSETSLT